MYVCRCLTQWVFFMLMSIYVCVYVCMYVCMSLSDTVIRNYPCGGMITYVGEWHEEVPGLTMNKLRRVVKTNIKG